MEAGALLRIQAPAPFTLRWTDDNGAFAACQADAQSAEDEVEINVEANLRLARYHAEEAASLRANAI